MSAEHRPSNFDLQFLRDNVSAARDVTTNAEILATRTLRELLKKGDILSIDRDNILEAATTTSQTMGVAAGEWLDDYDGDTIKTNTHNSGDTLIHTYLETQTYKGFSMYIEVMSASFDVSNLSMRDQEPDFVRRLRESDKLTKLQFAVELLSRATPVEQTQPQQATA